MATKILIPTPLRPFTDKLDAVEIDGATIGELLQNLTTKYGGLKQHLYSADGKLRSFVNVYVNDDDIRYLQKDQTPLKSGDTVSIIPSVAGGAPSMTETLAGVVRRRDQAIQPPPDHAGGRRRRSAQAESREGAVHRRGRAWLAGRDVSRRRRHRHARHRRFRRRRFQQPAAADHSRHARRRPRRSSRRRRIA